MENMNYCLSCSKPLSPEEASTTQGRYCEFCSDEKGELKSREEVVIGLAMWLESWAPVKENVDFKAKAEHYMKAMPAWS